MKIDQAPEEHEGEKVYNLEFSLYANGLHEAGVAINSMAYMLRTEYDEAFNANKNKNPKSRECLGAATERQLTAGADKFTADLQRLCREKSREGFLSDDVRLKAGQLTVAYLHNSLVTYRSATVEAVTQEVRSAMGNSAAFVRSNEAVIADSMACVIEEVVEVGAPIEERRLPLGFGRALLDSEIA